MDGVVGLFRDLRFVVPFYVHSQHLVAVDERLTDLGTNEIFGNAPARAYVRR